MRGEGRSCKSSGDALSIHRKWRPREEGLMGFLCVLRGVWESGKTESRLCPVAKIVNAFFGLFSIKFWGLGRLAALRFLEAQLDQGRLPFAFKGAV